jgi:hypothetical protein
MRYVLWAFELELCGLDTRSWSVLNSHELRNAYVAYESLNDSWRNS